MRSALKGPEKEESIELSRRIARRRPHEGQDANGANTLASKLFSDDKVVRASAVKRLSGRHDILLHLATSSSEEDIRLASVAMISDASALSEIASYCHFGDSREEAVRRLSGNRECLLWIACSSLFSDTRINAIDGLDDEGRAEVAIAAPRHDARKEALKGICGADSLVKVAEESPFRRTRELAVARLGSDLRSLCSIIQGPASKDAKKAAIALLHERLDQVGPEVLVEIASSAAVEDVRLLALAIMAGDPTSLRLVLGKARSWETRMTALTLLSEIVGEIDDSNLLRDIAIRSPDREGRAAALSKLSADTGSLIDIARRSRFKDTRASALRRISDDWDALRKIACSPGHKDSRRKAHALASDREKLRKALERLI